jgi:ABC-type polysaccharide/polyol phosphate export permease
MNKIARICKLVVDLSRSDFKARYAGSFLGVVWGIMNPLMTLCVYWFVFEIGFRSGPRPDGTAFIVWLACGMVIWFFMSESLLNSTNSLIEYSYLVKKISFSIVVLPVVKVVSSLYNHVFFLIVLLVIMFSHNYYPHITNVQFLYYLICGIYLTISIGLITSSLVVFIRDIAQIIGIVIQIGFWLIPIVWSPEIIKEEYMILFKLNPVYYLVEGYRDSFIDHIWFWDRTVQTPYFWLVTTMIFIVGVTMFKRLRPHFADVL